MISDAFPVLLVVLRGSQKRSNTIPFCPRLLLLKLFSHDTCLSVSLHQSGHILRSDRDVNLGTESSIVCNVCLWFVSFFPFLETVPESGTGLSQRCCSGRFFPRPPALVHRISPHALPKWRVQSAASPRGPLESYWSPAPCPGLGPVPAQLLPGSSCSYSRSTPVPSLPA